MTMKQRWNDNYREKSEENKNGASFPRRPLTLNHYGLNRKLANFKLGSGCNEEIYKYRI